MNFGLTNPELTVARTHNSTFAIDGVSCAADRFVVTESSALRIYDLYFQSLPSPSRKR